MFILVIYAYPDVDVIAPLLNNFLKNEKLFCQKNNYFNNDFAIGSIK